MTLSVEHFRFMLDQAAESHSYFRKLRGLVENPERLRDISSSGEDMLNDWLDARIFLILKVVEGGDVTLKELAPECYPLLEEAWLSRLQRLKAYYIWEKDSKAGPEGDYYQATQEIRKLLFEKDSTDSRYFKPFEVYIRERYLDQASRLDNGKHATEELIRGKARRIWQTRRDADEYVNWFRARLYVMMFYENIIPAVMERDTSSTRRVLQAFQFSKTPENRYLIVNCFEAAIAVDFLDKKTIRAILDNPSAYNISMVPLREEWPGQFAFPSICGSKFSYQADSRQMFYQGVMSEAERDALLAELAGDVHRRVVEKLFEQSQGLQMPL